MRASKSILKFSLGLLATLAGLGAALWLLAWCFGSEEPAQYSVEEIRQAELARQTTLDLDSPPRIQVPVDYSEGPAASWFPKNQSPVLDKLVEDGVLEPVAQRTGTEPVVVRGIEGIGKYGGTWMRAANSDNDAFSVNASRMGYATLVRWSPQGHPIVPHVAKGYQVSDDYRTYTFQLRKGMRWSDGQPYTADDIVYWWEAEANDPDLAPGGPPQVMQVRGESATLERLGPHEVRITFPHPNGLFLAKLATADGNDLIGRPKHYLEQFHPTRGNRDLIDRLRGELGLANDLAVYNYMRRVTNPEHPRLWPWVIRSDKPNPPFTFVRNPYYWMVDTEGNQLPYIDRLHFRVVRSEMIDVTAANGDLSMQARHIPYSSYTLLMAERQRGGFDVYHWYPGDRSSFIISPNLNLDTDRDDESDAAEARNKLALLNERAFRQALSLAINRQDIIDAEFSGQTTPAQVAPGPDSLFYQPDALNSFIGFDPGRANALLDAVGLTRRDSEGFRTFPDGSEMTWYLNFSQGPMATEGPAQFIIDDWADVGIRCKLRIRSRQLFYGEKAARQHDFNVWGGNGEFFPLLEPRFFVPVGAESNYALGFAMWYERGGLYGSELAQAPGCIEPPADHPLREAMELYEQCKGTGDLARQREIFGQILRIAAENVWTISICTPPPALVVVKHGFRNVPPRAVASWDFQTPGNAGLETYYFEEPATTPGAIRHTQAALAGIDEQATGTLGKLIILLIVGSIILVMALAGLRHPYILRRMLIMIPTLAIISVVVFIIIQLPPGDYVTNRIMSLKQSGDQAAIQQVKMLEDIYYLKDPMPVRYARWMGLKWFTSFADEDKGLLQGNLGRSMENDMAVNELVGDRILLTFLISLGTILFTWAVAIPTGIYSAVRQYSIGDYLLTFLGFIGMCVPGFLLALIVMYGAKELLGVQVSGLLSAEYAAQPDWDLAKVADLLKHIWVPVVVLGVAGTAGMIRIMRANLLDELKKPYVTTARAKGVRPGKLLMKYPVRLALNPFISGIGGLFPQLVSGGAIVAMVLSLPTVGPLMLSALMNEDMYLAGSMLMVLSLLGVFGTLVSDLLLLWLDPRIRFQGGTSR
jgi:ABC-type dipeptide/oligopeptide/nickel transport system permease component/ABC-type transport system substrate-binding protein